MSAPWDGILSAEDLRRYEMAGFGHPSGMGERPALLIIDVQYRTLGNSPKPFEQAVTEDYTTAVGEAGWAALGNIVRLVEVFRANGWPVLYPHVAPKLALRSSRRTVGCVQGCCASVDDTLCLGMDD